MVFYRLDDRNSAMIKKGFTLVELLVVISVIGILASLALVAFGPTQKQAKDTQRKSDLKQYQTALETFANSNDGLYPARTTSVDPATLCLTLGITGECPEDPKSDMYSYSYLSNGTVGQNDASDYLLWSVQEKTDGYWIVCSSGKSGSSEIAPSSVICPL